MRTQTGTTVWRPRLRSPARRGQKHARRRTQWILIPLALIAAFGLLPPARAQAPSEYQIKAGFLYNFAKFVTWPPDALEGSQLRLCLGGSDPFGASIEVVAGKRVGKATIDIYRLGETAEIAGCHILFVSAFTDESERWLQLAPRGVLTISEEGGDATQTGIIHLRLVENKIRFEIDRAAAERAGLEISSQLLSLALAVRN